MHIVLYFGSFNPIHKAHIKIANYVSNLEQVDEVWLVVSPQNPMKSIDILAPENHRLQMAKDAICAENIENKVKISDIEFSLLKPSYTYQTLNVLRNKYPQYKFSMLIGGDNLYSLDKWKCVEKIISTTKIFVYPRNCQKNEIRKYNGANIVILKDVEVMDVNSTAIRINTKDSSDLVGVTKRYIEKHGLYRCKS